MTRGKRVVLGCILVPLVLMVFLAVLVGIAFFAPTTPPEKVTRELVRELPAAEPVIELSSDAPKSPAQRIRIELEEGEFTIRPVADEQPLRVSGTFDASAYALESTPIDGAPMGSHAIRFHRSVGLLGMLGRMRTKSDIDNEIEIELPRGAPIDLSIRMRRGSMQVDLSGLSIRSLEIDHMMGDGSVVFERPNPETMSHLGVRGRMGDLRLEGLGWAHARDTRLEARMGDFTLDFSGDWDGDAQVAVKMRMGAANIVVPDFVTPRVRSKSVRLGELAAPAAVAIDPEARTDNPTLAIDVDLMFGEMLVHSDSHAD